MRQSTFCLLISFLFFISCTEKETILQTEHTNEIINGNTAPPYSEVTTVQVQNYINKAFIDLLGYEPIVDTLQKYTDFLRAGNLVEDRRNEFLEVLMFSSGYKQDYYERLDEVLFVNYLAATPKTEVLEQRNVYQNIYEDYLQQGETTLAQLVKLEIDKLDNLLRAFIDYSQQGITMNEYIRRVCNNPVYDEINMGSENYVLSCFENFHKRLPTDAELEAGVTMVDGFSAQLLLSDGSSRDDFLQIITEDGGFYEGLAIDVYRQMLARLPNSEEMTTAILEMSAGLDYPDLQRLVMVSEEYAGF